MFPFPVGIVARWAIHLIESISKRILCSCFTLEVVGNIVIVTNTILLTSDTITNTEFHIRDYVNIFQEIFLLHFPSKCSWREVTPTVARAKSRRSISTESSSNNVLVLNGKVHPTKPRKNGVLRFIKRKVWIWVRTFCSIRTIVSVVIVGGQIVIVFITTHDI